MHILKLMKILGTTLVSLFKYDKYWWNQQRNLESSNPIPVHDIVGVKNGKNLFLQPFQFPFRRLSQIPFLLISPLPPPPPSSSPIAAPSLPILFSHSLIFSYSSITQEFIIAVFVLPVYTVLGAATRRRVRNGSVIRSGTISTNISTDWASRLIHARNLC